MFLYNFYLQMLLLHDIIVKKKEGAFMGIGTNLKELISLKGTNVNELAAKAGISPQTLYAIIKRDNTKIDTNILLKLAHALDVPSESILSFTEKYSIPSKNSVEYLLGNIEESTAIGILSDLSKLNTDGKKEAGKRVNELTEIKKYTE